MSRGIKLKHSNNSFYLEVDGNEIKEINSYSINTLPDNSVELNISLIRQSEDISINLTDC